MLKVCISPFIRTQDRRFLSFSREYRSQNDDNQKWHKEGYRRVRVVKKISETVDGWGGESASTGARKGVRRGDGYNPCTPDVKPESGRGHKNHQMMSRVVVTVVGFGISETPTNPTPPLPPQHALWLIYDYQCPGNVSRVS